jgi:hypothetical protein
MNNNQYKLNTIYKTIDKKINKRKNLGVINYSGTHLSLSISPLIVTFFDLA